MYIHFNRDYLRALFKVELNYAGNVWCDILSKGGISHMNAGATM
jgi:hypothetical protein